MSRPINIKSLLTSCLLTTAVAFSCSDARAQDFMDTYGPAIRGAVAGTSAAGTPLGWDKVGSGMVLALQGGFDEEQSRTGVGPLRIVFRAVDEPNTDPLAGYGHLQLVFLIADPVDFSFEDTLSAKQPTRAVVVFVLLF